MTGLPTSFHLTDEWIRSLPTPTKETRIFDTECRSLLVRCRPSGSKSFYFQSYEWSNPKSMDWSQFYYAIGSVRKLTVSEARIIARRAEKIPSLLDREARVSRKAPLADIIKMYMSEGMEGRRGICFSAHTAHLSVKYLMRHLPKIMGSQRLCDLSQADLMEYFERLNMHSPTEAEHAHKKAKAFLYWCASAGIVKANPLTKTKLPKASRGTRRDISFTEIAKIYLATQEIDNVSARLVRFSIITACDFKRARNAKIIDVCGRIHRWHPSNWPAIRDQLGT